MKRLINKYIKYHPDPDIKKLDKAFDLAKIAYYGEKRRNGDDWLQHALSVAELTSDLKMDTDTICAALLHDAYLFGLAPKDIDAELGEEVRQIVDSVDKVKGLSDKYSRIVDSANYSDYLRRIILIVGKDLRAVVIRLAEKYEELDSIEVLDEKLQRKAVDRAFTVYSPLAKLIGMNELKELIEDRAFKLSNPGEYELCNSEIMRHPLAKQSKLQAAIKDMKKSLESEGVSAVDLFGRTKSPFSFHEKMQRKDIINKESNIAPSNINDKVGITVLANSVEDCYKALDVLHSKYDFFEKYFDDYIAAPKTNGYKSIQAVVEVSNGHTIEVQIKTPEMHDFNEYGPASHVFYKLYQSSDASNTTEQKIEMLRKLLKWRDNLLDDISESNVEGIDDTILVFTPKGDIIELPDGATPIDFAYQIHSDLGNKITRAIVDGAIKPLTYKLKCGELVEIKIDKKRKKPSLDWLDSVKTKYARINIKKHAR